LTAGSVDFGFVVVAAVVTPPINDLEGKC